MTDKQSAEPSKEVLSASLYRVATEIESTIANLVGPAADNPRPSSVRATLKILEREFSCLLDAEIAKARLESNLYAAYANHCAIQKKVPLTFHSWKREQATGKQVKS